VTLRDFFCFGESGVLLDMDRRTPSVRTTSVVPAGALRVEYPGVISNDDIHG
jgi:hypothetical protein